MATGTKQQPVPASSASVPAAPRTASVGTPSFELQSYRDLLVKADESVLTAYDKAVMTLSGGALAISLTFIKDVVKAPKPNNPNLLLIGWGGLLVSIVAILVSMLTSHWALRKAIQQTDEGKIRKERPGKYLAIYTEVLNILASVGFIVGVIFLALFAFRNLSQ